MTMHKLVAFIQPRLKAVAALLTTSGAAIAYAAGVPAWVVLLVAIIISPAAVYQTTNGATNV
mgnify:CR=1 FL=1|tara:strand:+ start:839 stop:1024 length:186 start_codon:yes stop_codon:yes gene_type:complete